MSEEPILMEDMSNFNDVLEFRSKYWTSQQKKEMLYQNLKTIFEKFVKRNVIITYHPHLRKITTEDIIGKVDMIYDEFLIINGRKLRMISIWGIEYI